MAKEKKRKYGIKRLSKEENMRMTKRTEERLEIAKAKENLWRQYRGQREMRTEEEDAWEMIRRQILELEEGGTWIEKGKETSLMKGRLQNPKENIQDRIEARDEVRNRVCEVWDMGEKVSGAEVKNVLEVGDGLDGVREGPRMSWS